MFIHFHMFLTLKEMFFPCEIPLFVGHIPAMRR